LLCLNTTGCNKDNNVSIEATKPVTDYLKTKDIFIGYTPENHDAYLDSVQNQSRWEKTDSGESVTEFYRNQAKYQLFEWSGCSADGDNMDCRSEIGIKVFPVRLMVNDFISDQSMLKDLDIKKPSTIYIKNTKTGEYLIINCENSQINDVTWGQED
jgi:hypothetical protein